MTTNLNYKKLAITTLLIALIAIGLTSMAGAAGTIQVDVNDGGCVLGTGQGDPYAVTYCKIQDAVVDATAGDTINVANGLYPEIISITKGLTLNGASEAGVVIDATSAGGYHFTVDANDVTLQNFTLLGKNTPPASYGIKVSGLNATTRHYNFSISDVTVQDTYRTGLDINGLEDVTVNDVTVTGVPYGNGVSLTDVDDATLDNITTSGNAWGGIAVYTYGRYYPLGSDNVAVTNVNASELNPFYVELGNYNNPGSPEPVTNLSAPQFFYTVVNEPEKPLHTFYQETEPLAVAFALLFTSPYDSYINRLADGNFIVSNDGASEMGIQTAIDEATAGDTIEVRDGTYVEALMIDGKSLTIIGDSTSAIVESPAIVPSNCFSTPSALVNKAVACIKGGSDVILDSLGIDGNGQGNANYRFVGVGVSNSSATVQNSAITGVRDNPLSGSQHGVAIYSWNEDTVPQTINVWNNSIDDFQKNAMALNADSDTPVVVDVAGNTIVGAGPLGLGLPAQNGIQTLGALVTGNVYNNAISGIGYTEPSYVATSILNYYGSIDFSGNTVSAGHVGLYNIDALGTIDSNTMSIEKIGAYGYGIIASDPPDAVPSPFGAGDSQGGSGSRGLHAPEALLNVSISGNVVSFSGGDNTGTYGIEADAGYGLDDLNVVASNNVVTGFGVGIGWYECTSGCSTGEFTSIVATDNCIAGNTIGMESNVSYLTVNAENNWWGDASGPYNNPGNPVGLGDEVVGDIDFDPWGSTCAADLWHNTTADTIHVGLQAALDAASPGDVIQPFGDGPHTGGATANNPGVTIDLNGGTGGPGSPFLTVAAANVTVVGPGTLDGLGSASPAIKLVTDGDNFTLEDVEVTGWANGVQITAPVTSFKMVGNYVHGNTNAGLLIDAGAALSGVITIEGNLFKDNGVYGVENLNGSTVDAEFNSWGCFAGPGNVPCDSASADVDYDPWTFSEMFLDMDPTSEVGTVNRLEGETFDVAMLVDAKNLTSLEFDFTYDETMLTLNGPPTFSSPWAGSCFQVGSPPTGQVHYYCSIIYPSPGYTSPSSTIATFSFTAEDNGGLTGSGPWSAYFDLDVATTTSASVGGVKVFVNNAGYGAPETRALIDDTNDGVVEIGPSGNFAGFIDLQGRSNDTGGVLEVYDDSIRATASLLATGTSVSSGSYATSPLLLPLPTNTIYWLYADAPLYLPTTANSSVLFAHSADLDTRPLTELNLLLLLGGDATDDNFINIYDATCIGTDFGMSLSTCSTGSSDVNADGIINVLDLSLMGGNWMAGASAWIPQ